MYGVAFDATEKIETMDEAKELYQKLVLAKIKTKSMEDMLKWYINHNSPLEFKNETYGPQIFESTKYSDPGKLMDLLRDEKIPEGAILDMISTNKTNVEKVIKKFKLADDLKKKIYGYSTKEFTTKFVAKKKQDERSDEEGSVDPYL